MNKLGITPLMATFLLISFAVALGTFLTQFGRAEIEESAVCPVNIDLLEKKICIAGDKIVFSLQNGLNTDLNGLVVSIIGTEEAKTLEIAEIKLAKGGIYDSNLPYDPNIVGSLRQVKISPRIMLYDEEHICIEQGLVKENIADC